MTRPRYDRGDRVEVLWQGEWLPSRIVRCWSDGADVVVGSLGCWYAQWELIRDGMSELEQMAREVVSAYEGVTMTGEWLQLSMPIVALRAALWRIDGVIP